MHEFSLASELMNQLLRIAAERNAVRFTEVVVRCGVMQQVVPEALVLAFDALSQGTPAAGAKLNIVAEPVMARCRKCDTIYGAALDDYSCRKCRQTDVEIVAGRDIILQSVTADTRDDLNPAEQQAAGAPVARRKPERP